MFNSAKSILKLNHFKNIVQSIHTSQKLDGLKKRFYKTTNILYSDGKYEITLDHRKLKTPNGSLFYVKSEPLAIAIATEWDSQKDVINQASMHLTALCFTALDNPNRLQKHEMANYCLNFMATDTIIFHAQGDDEKELIQLQKTEWEPTIQWFNKRYNTNLKSTTGFDIPDVDGGDKMNIGKYLLSHKEEVLHGFVFAVDTLKSIILAFAAIDQHLDVKKAVYLARLEEEYQLKFWGRVEWSHDLSEQELQARLAASILYIQLNRTEYLVKEKLVV